MTSEFNGIKIGNCNCVLPRETYIMESDAPNARVIGIISAFRNGVSVIGDAIHTHQNHADFRTLFRAHGLNPDQPVVIRLPGKKDSIPLAAYIREWNIIRGAAAFAHDLTGRVEQTEQIVAFCLRQVMGRLTVPSYARNVPA